MDLKISDTIKLVLSQTKHAQQLLETVDANRLHLSVFLSWVPHMQTVYDCKNYLQGCENRYKEGTEVSFNIFEDETIIGRVGLSLINQINKTANIGYWLSANAVGKGIMTKAVRHMLQIGFEELQLNRLEIKAAVENKRSRAIPVKLNFTEEGILRESELVNSTYYNIVMYSLLKKEYQRATHSF